MAIDPATMMMLGQGVNSVGKLVDSGMNIYGTLETLKMQRAAIRNQERQARFARMMNMMNASNSMFDRSAGAGRLFALRNPGMG